MLPEIVTLRRELEQLRAASGENALVTSWVPAWTSLTTTGAPIYSGLYSVVGRMLFFTILINANGGTTASSLGTTIMNNLPIAATGIGNGILVTNFTTFVQIPNGIIYPGTTSVYTPTWTATGNAIYISGWYFF